MGLYGVIQGACGAIEAYGISIGIAKVGYKIWCVYIVYNTLQLVGKFVRYIPDSSDMLICISIVLCLPRDQQIESRGNRCGLRNTRCGACEDVIGHPKGKEGEEEIGQGGRNHRLSIVCGRVSYMVDLDEVLMGRDGDARTNASVWGISLASPPFTNASHHHHGTIHLPLRSWAFESTC